MKFNSHTAASCNHSFLLMPENLLVIHASWICASPIQNPLFVNLGNRETVISDFLPAACGMVNWWVEFDVFRFLGRLCPENLPLLGPPPSWRPPPFLETSLTSGIIPTSETTQPSGITPTSGTYPHLWEHPLFGTTPTFGTTLISGPTLPFSG